MSSEANWDRAVEKLISLTLSGELTWMRDLPGVKREDAEGGVYTAIVEGRRIAVYEYRFKYYHDEDNWEWQREVAIEFVDHSGATEWRWAPSRRRWRLLDAIRCVLARAPEFLKSFLGDEMDAH